MNLKIIGLSGSYRKESGTTHFVSRALEGARSLGFPVDTELITLREKKLRPESTVIGAMPGNGSV